MTAISVAWDEDHELVIRCAVDPDDGVGKIAMNEISFGLQSRRSFFASTAD
jgi:hypothetical protein